jgi:2',3'-cyclic-nucleotide 2'-phosphodiesterase (5'-nucleotidase family)
MKQKIWLFLTLSLFLTSCQFIGHLSSPTQDSSFLSGKTSSSLSSSSDTVSSAISGSSSQEGSAFSSSVSGSSSGTSALPSSVTIYSLNDLHGSLRENEDGGELGVARLSYAIHHDADYDPSTSLILCGGDSWQGGYLSYMDKSLTDKCLSDLGVEAMTIGNHEFDWGWQTIEAQSKVSPYPYLACNILDYSGNQATWCKPSTEITKGGIKYGVVGAIGADEASSIASGKMGDYSFSSSTTLVKNEVDKLYQDGCQIIVFLVHDAYDSTYTVSLGDTFSLENDHVSGIFGGHSHQFNSEIVGNLPYVQGGSNSKGYCKMKFSTKTGGLLAKSYVTASSTDFSVSDAALDSRILNLIDTAVTQYQPDQVLAHFDQDFRRYYELSKFIPTAMNSVVTKYGYTTTRTLLGLHNLSGIRSVIPAGDVTMDDLYKTSPFDNKIKIIENVRGSEISRVLGTVSDSNNTKYYAYATSDGTSFSTSTYYDVVTIDFVSEGYLASSISLKTQIDGGKNGAELLIRDGLRYYFTYGGRAGDSTFYAADYQVS